MVVAEMTSDGAKVPVVCEARRLDEAMTYFPHFLPYRYSGSGNHAHFCYPAGMQMRTATVALENWHAERALRRRALFEQRAEVVARDTLTFDSPAALIAAVEERQGWPAGYLEHLAQPYCECEPERDDGWSFCLYARDRWPGLLS